MRALSELTIRSVRKTDWPSIESLFGKNGACGGCWCMTWRLERGGQLYEKNKGSPNRRRFRKLLESGDVHGLVAFDGDDPVAWCAVGPKAEFPKLKNSRVLNVSACGDDWSVLCFYVKKNWRRRGLATKMLAQAVDYAMTSGATVLDGFPVSRRKGSEIAPAFAWTGLPEMFDACGFQKIRRAKIRRPHYRFTF